MSKFSKLLLGGAALVATLLIGVGTGVSLKKNGGDNQPVVLTKTLGVMASTNDASSPAPTKTVYPINPPADRVITLIGVVNGVSIANAVERLNQLQDGNGPVYLVIDSPGGLVFEGYKLVTAMESSKQKIVTVCAGICASMAAVIFSYGDERVMVDRATLMYHDAFGGAQGNVSNMKAQIDYIQRSLNKSNAYIAQRAGLTFEAFEYLMLKNVWVDAEDAVSRKFADKVGFLKVTLPSPTPEYDEEEGKQTSTETNTPGTRLLEVR